VLTDAQGVPLAVKTTPANTPGGEVALPLLVAMPPIHRPKGRPRTKPKVLQGDAAYGTAALTAIVNWLGIKPLLAPYGKRFRSHGTGLGKTRWIVERTLSWFGNFRRLKLCYEKSGTHFQAFHELAAAILCSKRFTQLSTRF
jgi:transposase